MRGLQKLLEEGADCTQIAQQLLATRHALVAGSGTSSQAVSEVLDLLQHKLGRSR